MLNSIFNDFEDDFETRVHITSGRRKAKLKFADWTGRWFDADGGEKPGYEMEENVFLWSLRLHGS